jgi:hypothetical protein
MRDRGDGKTLDLLEWEPPVLAPVVSEEKVRSGSLRGRMARAVALALRECELPREAVAERMGEFLGEDVTLGMVNNYASQAKEEHTISAIRLAALAHATGDLRPLQILAATFEHSLIPTRYLPAIEDALLDDKIEELERRRKVARSQWKGPRTR